MANPAAPSESSFGSRRFVASATSNTGQMMKYTFLFILGAMAALGVVNLVLFIIGALLDARAVTKIGSAVTFCAFLVIAMPAYAAFSRRVNRPKQVLIDVTGAGFTVSVPGA